MAMEGLKDEELEELMALLRPPSPPNGLLPLVGSESPPAQSLSSMIGQPSLIECDASPSQPPSTELMPPVGCDASSLQSPPIELLPWVRCYPPPSQPPSTEVMPLVGCDASSLQSPPIGLLPSVRCDPLPWPPPSTELMPPVGCDASSLQPPPIGLLPSVICDPLPWPPPSTELMPPVGCDASSLQPLLFSLVRCEASPSQPPPIGLTPLVRCDALASQPLPPIGPLPLVSCDASPSQPPPPTSSTRVENRNGDDLNGAKDKGKAIIVDDGVDMELEFLNEEEEHWDVPSTAPLMTMTSTMENPLEDGYNWRKYGQKNVKGDDHPRSYYRCTHPKCETKKKVIHDNTGEVTEIVYSKLHNHKPLRPVHYGQLGLVFPTSGPSHGVLTTDGSAGTTPNSTSGSSLPYLMYDPRVRHVRKRIIEIESEVDVVDDGYRWRKYGQKVVKGNPNPRNYYKCVIVKCPTRKQVERSFKNAKTLLITYEGKHPHAPQPRRSASLGGGRGGRGESPSSNTNIANAPPRVPTAPLSSDTTAAVSAILNPTGPLQFLNLDAIADQLVNLNPIPYTLPGNLNPFPFPMDTNHGNYSGAGAATGLCDFSGVNGMAPLMQQQQIPDATAINPSSSLLQPPNQQLQGVYHLGLPGASNGAADQYPLDNFDLLSITDNEQLMSEMESGRHKRRKKPTRKGRK